jgi:hypothetical protein
MIKGILVFIDIPAMAFITADDILAQSLWEGICGYSFFK